MAPPNPFLGRQTELDVLRRAADDVQNRGVPRFVLIEGPPGVGKTALLNEAVRYVSDWWRANAYLDAEDREVPGAGARQLLRKPLRDRVPTDRDELTSWVQATVDAISEPIVVVMEDLHKIDDVSAGIIHQVIRNVEDVPMLNLVTTRPSERREIQRFQRLADTLGEAIYLRLRPFTPQEVGEHLETMSGQPVSPSAAERVHRVTDGFPELVRFVGQRLVAGDFWTPAHVLREALHELASGVCSGLTLERVVGEVLDESTQEVQRMLAALAVAERPLSARELAQVVALEEIDVCALRRSGLVHRSFTDGRFIMAHRVYGVYVAAKIRSEERAALHSTLGEIGSDARAVRHRAEAALLDPCIRPEQETVDELIQAARRASDAGALEETLRLTSLAFSLSPTDASLEALCIAAIRAGAHSDLSHAAAWVQQHGVHGVLRRSVLARESLLRGDLENALSLLSRAGDLQAASPKSLIIFAHTVFQTARTASIHDSYLPVSHLVTRTARSVEALERSVIEEQAEVETGVASSRQMAAVLRMLRVVLTAWESFEHWDYAPTASFTEAVEQKLQELREVPGTEQGQMLLLIVRALRLRLAGHGDRAFADLTAALSCSPDTDVRALAYAHLHMSIVLFDAGLWDEAQEHAGRGAAEVLNVLEENIGAMAFLLDGMVPAARGEGAGEYLRMLAASPWGTRYDKSALVRAVRGYAQAWVATATRDYERVVVGLAATRVEPSMWSRALPQAVMLGRAYCFTQRRAALPSLVREAESDTISSPALRGYAVAHLKGLQALSVGDRLEAMGHFDEALEQISGVPSAMSSESSGDGGALRMYRALLVLEMGHCAVTGGEELADRAEQIKGLLLWAASVFGSCRAEGLYRQAEELYVSLRRGAPRELATNGRPTVLLDLPEGLSAKALSSLSSLTSREREISLMVGQGLTNKDVAEQLVLSVRTVEYHVANVLGKLTLDSRYELRRLLDGDDMTIAS